MRRLRFLRLERRLSQRQVASLIRVTQPELSRIETGRMNPTDRELSALARLFNCAAEHLLDPVVDAFLDHAEGRR